MEVARSLGLSYLWIDTLCIWQTDLADLEKELSKMDGYYRNSTVAIQSSGTKSVEEKFLDDNSRLLSPRSEQNVLKLPFLTKDGLTDEIFVQNSDNLKWYKQNREHAVSRGWILQEELLCKRILTFPSVGGVVFRCDGDPHEFRDGRGFNDSGHSRSRKWTKAALLTEESAQKMGIRRVSDGLKTQLAEIRHIASFGLKPILTLALSDDHPNFAIIEIDRDAKRLEKTGYYVRESDTDIFKQKESADGTEEILQARVRLTPDHRQIPPDEILDAIPELSAQGHLKQLHPQITSEPDPDTVILPDAIIVNALGSQSLVRTKPPKGSVMPQDIDKQWKGIVDSYCQRSLTNPTDKLIAIAALASEYSQRYEPCLGHYKAGIWEKFLPSNLLWKVRAEVRMPPIPELKEILSWSWAAVEGASFKNVSSEDDAAWDYCDPEVTILRCGTNLRSPNLAFGDVVGCFIKLSGSLLDINWGPGPSRKRADSSGTIWGPGPDETDCQVLDAKTSEQLGYVCEAYPDNTDSQPKSGPRPATFLLVQRSGEAIRSPVVSEKGHVSRLEGLLLNQNRTSDEYIRMGYLCCYFEPRVYENWAGMFRNETVTIV